MTLRLLSRTWLLLVLYHDGRWSRCHAAAAVQSASAAVLDQQAHVGNNTIPSAAYEVPLLASSGSHHLRLLVGEPAVPQLLIVDTGSHLSSWKCFGKATRGAPVYEPGQSATAIVVLCDTGCHFQKDSVCETVRKPGYINKKGCVLQQRYAEGSSWTAYEVNDLVSVGLSALNDEDIWWLDESALSTTLPYTFGCQTSASGLFRRQFAHGILGLGRFNNHSLPHQLHRYRVTDNSLFSLCLSKNGGSLGFGGALHRLHDEPMQFTKLLSHPNRTTNLYTVQVEEVWLGDACLTSHVHNPSILRTFSTGRGTILDSGTTDTFLPRALGGVFDTAWREQTGRTYSHRSLLSREEFAQLPSLRIVLEGNVSVVVTPSHFMDGADAFHNDSSSTKEDKRLLFSTIHNTELRGAALGINFMVGYDVLFDSERVGFAAARCGEKSSPSSVPS